MCDAVFAKINDILSNWNPLEVPTDLATEEYKSYVKRIIQVGQDCEKIKAELVAILTSDLGVIYDETNETQRSNVENVVIKILRVQLQ